MPITTALQLKKMKKEQRIALVIGNSNYQYLSKLKNPINDAKAMRQALSELDLKIYKNLKHHLIPFYR